MIEVQKESIQYEEFNTTEKIVYDEIRYKINSSMSEEEIREIINDKCHYYNEGNAEPEFEDEEFFEEEADPELIYRYAIENMEE